MDESDAPFGIRIITIIVITSIILLLCIGLGVYLKKINKNIQPINKSVQQEFQKSRYIPKHVQREVWRRDNGRCVECGSNKNLEFDQIIPFSKGGSNTTRNIQL